MSCAKLLQANLAVTLDMDIKTFIRTKVNTANQNGEISSNELAEIVLEAERYAK